MEFIPFEKGIEVNGTTIMSVIDGMGSFRKYAEYILNEVGINDLVPDENHWYSQERWLNAFQKIAIKVGKNTLYQIGIKIPENAIFPEGIDTLEKGLASIDVAYHINHRNMDKQVLFDPSNAPPMKEGIGHYFVEKVNGNGDTFMVCENPYPCDFDRGIITSVARRFSPKARVKHLDEYGCRNEGHSHCTYLIEN
ncbi:MAG: hypothetical protein ACXAD7_25785 [Candidatus Kariarchaeaceae archaeon]|jgi:hypothetical protein